MKLRIILAVSLLVALCSGMAAQDGFYNSKVGTTLKWAIYDGSGDLFGYCHEKLVSMEGNKSNGKISYAYMFYDRDRKSVVGNKPFEFYVTLENGVTKAYVNNVAKAIQSGDYMPVADLSSIPDNISVGDKVKDTEIKVKVLTVVTVTNSYLNRRVTAKETVKVPAGTYECFLVEDDESFTNSGPFHVKTWVAKGVGIVRQVIYKKDGTVNQTYELIK